MVRALSLVALCACVSSFAPAVPRARAVSCRTGPVMMAGNGEPSRVSRVLHKISFGFLGSKAAAAPPALFQESSGEVRLDGAKYADDLEAFMDTPAPARPSRKSLKAPSAIEGGEAAEDEEGGTAVKEKKKEMKAPREALASEADVEKLNKLFGMSSASK